jgi:hypothetical protein
MRVLSGGAFRRLGIRRRGQLPKSVDTPGIIIIIISASHGTKKKHHTPRSGNQGEQATRPAYMGTRE